MKNLDKPEYYSIYIYINVFISVCFTWTYTCSLKKSIFITINLWLSSIEQMILPCTISHSVIESYFSFSETISIPCITRFTDHQVSQQFCEKSVWQFFFPSQSFISLQKQVTTKSLKYRYKLLKYSLFLFYWQIASLPQISIIFFISCFKSCP